MPSRRQILSAIGAGGLTAIAGCSSQTTIRMDSGMGTIHPADELHIAHGLQPDGNANVFARVVPDQAPEYVGPAASTYLRDTLQNPAPEVFHVIIQIRSTPEGPIELSLDDVRRRNQKTIDCAVTVAPWGSFSRIDDTELRERLQSADELVYTSVWSLTPSPKQLPETVHLSLTHR